MIKIIALDVKEPIPACAIILERNVTSQLHQLFFGKLVTQTRIQLVGNVRGRVRKGVSQFNDQSFSIIERRQVFPENCAQFLITQACFSAHGRINVYSKRTADARSGADSSQLNVAQ
jgi:hypothetical protein